MSSKRAGTYRTFYRDPVRIARASGCVIEDVDGRRLLDAYNNVPVLGHSHPGVAEAVRAELLRANTHTRYLDDAVDAYAGRLLSLLPQHIESVVFTCSGSEANDLALQVARYSSMAEGVIVVRRAYHGTTTATAAVSPSLSPQIPDTTECIDLPDHRSADFDAALAARVREAAAALESRGHGLAALLLDSTMTSEGIITGEHVRLSRTTDAVHDLGGFWIADEVQAGFRRTGPWFGFEKLGAAPDLVTLGKPMGAGLPIAAVAGPSVVFSDFGARQRYFNTFAGTPATIAAAGVVLDALSASGEEERITALAARLASGLEEAATASGAGGEVRANGLMVGLDLRTETRDEAAAGALAGEVVERMRELGVLISSTGPSSCVLKIRPPLVVAEAEVDEIARVCGEALSAAL